MKIVEAVKRAKEAEDGCHRGGELRICSFLRTSMISTLIQSLCLPGYACLVAVYMVLACLVLLRLLFCPWL